MLIFDMIQQLISIRLRWCIEPMTRTYLQAYFCFIRLMSLIHAQHPPPAIAASLPQSPGLSPNFGLQTGRHHWPKFHHYRSLQHVNTPKRQCISLPLFHQQPIFRARITTFWRFISLYLYLFSSRRNEVFLLYYSFLKLYTCRAFTIIITREIFDTIILFHTIPSLYDAA
jgi:hypothetical protein